MLPEIIGLQGVAAPIGVLTAADQAELDGLRDDPDVLVSVTAGADELELYDPANQVHVDLSDTTQGTRRNTNLDGGETTVLNAGGERAW